MISIFKNWYLRSKLKSKKYYNLDIPYCFDYKPRLKFIFETQFCSFFWWLEVGLTVSEARSKVLQAHIERPLEPGWKNSKVSKKNLRRGKTKGKTDMDPIGTTTVRFIFQSQICSKLILVNIFFFVNYILKGAILSN